MKFRVSPEIIASLPNSPGVYLFYGPQEELLYVGKSKVVRTRVRSHFSAAEERWLCRKVNRVEVRRTAGELGALLLESQLIKEMRPFYNRAQRQRRRLIVARRVLNKQGYIVINLDAVDYLEVRESEPILGVFKHRTQAKEFLDMIAKSGIVSPSTFTSATVPVWVRKMSTNTTLVWRKHSKRAGSKPGRTRVPLRSKSEFQMVVIEKCFFWTTGVSSAVCVLPMVHSRRACRLRDDSTTTVTRFFTVT
jgi:hypothetical protein